MRGFLRRAVGLGLLAAAVAMMASAPAAARRRAPERSSPGAVPYLDVKGSCSDAQKFSTGEDKKTAYNGCMQDEMNAKADLDKRWGTFKASDRSNCVEQSRTPSPSYVEVLTCLEMDTDAIRNAPRSGGGQSQIGGPVAPGLTNDSPPSSTMQP